MEKKDFSLDNPTPSVNKAKYSRYYTYIQPVIKNPFVKSVLPYIFTVVTVTVFIFFVIRPTITTILQLNKNIEESKQVLQTLKTKSDNLAQGRQNLDAMEQKTRLKIGAIIPATPNITSLIKSLNGSPESSPAAATVQIQPITLVNTAARPNGMSLGEVDFSFNTSGSYLQLLSFIHNLNKTPRLLDIDNLTISRQRGENTVLIMGGNAYHLK